jgi:hypothetical protein
MDPSPAESSPNVLPVVGLTGNELAFALFLVGLVYLAVSLPAIGRLLARVGSPSKGDGA